MGIVQGIEHAPHGALYQDVRIDLGLIYIVFLYETEYLEERTQQTLCFRLLIPRKNFWRKTDKHDHSSQESGYYDPRVEYGDG